MEKYDWTSVSRLLRSKRRPYWVDYDEDTDTLYLSFRKPQAANDGMMEKDFFYHYDGQWLVGIAVLHAFEMANP